MIQQEFSGELSQVIRQMQHFVHTQLSQHRDRGQTTITVNFAQSLLKKVSNIERDQQKAQLELFLTGLEQVIPLWKTSKTATAHLLRIETEMDASSKKESIASRILSGLKKMVKDEETGNFEEQSTSRQPSTAKPSHSAHAAPPPIQSNSRYPRFDRALNTFASELRSFVHLSNQRDDGKKVFAINRVMFTPKSAQADAELNAYLSIQKTSAHWSARIKSHFTQEEDKKVIVPYLTFSGVQFVNLGVDRDQDDEDYPSNDAQNIDSLDYDISFDSDERDYQPPTEPKPSTNNTVAIVTLEIRDKGFSNAKPRTVSTDLEQFTVGRNGDIKIEVGHRHFCSAEHLLFSKHGDQWVVQDTSSNYSLHNGEKMVKEIDVLVKSGDAFRLGAKTEENINDKYDQFPEVKINLPTIKRDNQSNIHATPTPIRTDIADPIPNTFNRTELTDDFTSPALLYTALWIDNDWQKQHVISLPARIGRKGGNTRSPVAIEIPATYSKVSAEHLDIVRFTEASVVIKVCDSCTNGVFWYKDDTENARLDKGRDYEIPYECPIFLAAQHDPKSLKIQFVRQTS